MAKQTVINFLKTCINMYIVLLDPVLFFKSKNRSQRSWDHMACRLLCEAESVGITGDF